MGFQEEAVTMDPPLGRFYRSARGVVDGFICGLVLEKKYKKIQIRMFR